MKTGNWNILLTLFILLCFSQCIFGAIVNNFVLNWAGGTDSCVDSNLSGDYACNSGADPGDWSNGIKYFTDTLTNLDYVVTQVNATLQGSFDCYQGVNVTILLNKISVGVIDIEQNPNPYCEICSNSWFPNTQSASSAYKDGWPAYVYGHINEVALLLDGGTIDTRFCVSQLILNITYQPLHVPDSSSHNDHFELDAPVWFWTLVILVGVIVMVLVIVFFHSLETFKSDW